MKRIKVAAAAAVLALPMTGCGEEGAERTQILVFAASSLRDAFAEIAAAFETSHPDVEVALNFAGSSNLRDQIREGAPADVFASADEANMALVLEEAEKADAPVAFAGNEMVIAVPPGNPAGITALADFGDSGLLIGLCAEPVPCGVLARASLAAAGVTPSVDTAEPNVRALLTKIESGELDGGIVYSTDVIGNAGVEAVRIPAIHNVRAEYPIVALGGAAAAEFVAFVISPAGQSILERHGFLPP